MPKPSYDWRAIDKAYLVDNLKPAQLAKLPDAIKQKLTARQITKHFDSSGIARDKSGQIGAKLVEWTAKASEREVEFRETSFKLWSDAANAALSQVLEYESATERAALYGAACKLLLCAMDAGYIAKAPKNINANVGIVENNIQAKVKEMVESKRAKPTT